jgi:translation initiation factor 3 subunit M
LLEISGKAGITQFVDVSLPTVEGYVAEWRLRVEQKRELLRNLHSALTADKRTDAAFEVMMALLRTYTDADADHAKEDARECVRTAIVDPKSFSFDHLLNLSAVQLLQKSDPKIYQLLLIFSTGKLSEYRRVKKDNAVFVQDVRKIKIDKKVHQKFCSHISA